MNKVADIHLIAKIEKPEAVDDIDAIIDASDGLMVARGDLGVEMDVAQVPIIQKDLIRRCQTAGKPVIVATQMLQSMIEQSSPTRAEVSDVANAIFDGTDAVMLSGETSVGKFPVGTVHTMAHIAEVTENIWSTKRKRLAKSEAQNDAAFRGRRQGCLADRAGSEGDTGGCLEPNRRDGADLFQDRFPVPIIAMSSDHRALRRMALHYGVIPQEMSPPRDMGLLVYNVDAMVQQNKFAEAGPASSSWPARRWARPARSTAS